MPKRAVTEKTSEQLELPVGSQGARSNGAALNGAGADVRARAIVDSLDSLSSEAVFAAFEELDALPPETVRAALAPTTGPAPDPDRLDDVARRALGLPPRPLRLATRAVVKDADIFDLGDVVEEQLRIAGRSWDGRDLPAEERLDEEVEGSFAGTVEHRVLADAESPASPPMFDVLRYAGDAGAIFRAGTTELVGAISGTTVEMRDRRARIAIQEALGLGWPEAAPSAEAEAEPEPPAEEPADVQSAEPAVAAASKPAARAPKKAAGGAKKKTTAGDAKKKTATAKKTATTKKAAAAKKTAGAKKTSSTKKKTSSKKKASGD